MIETSLYIFLGVSIIFGAIMATVMVAKPKSFENLESETWAEQRKQEWRRIRANWFHFPFVIKTVLQKIFYPPKGAGEWIQARNDVDQIAKEYAKEFPDEEDNTTN